jgi:hypothetical protein
MDDESMNAVLSKSHILNSCHGVKNIQTTDSKGIMEGTIRYLA